MYTDRNAFNGWYYSEDNIVYSSPADMNYLGEFHKFLYQVFVQIFNKVILENKECTADTIYTDADGKLSASVAEEIKHQMDLHQGDDTDRRSLFCRNASALFGIDEFIPFNKMPKFIFDYFVNHRADASLHVFIDKFKDYLVDNLTYFIDDVYKSIGAHQIANGTGAPKTTLCNKLVKVYYDWLTALSIGYPGNSMTLDCSEGFDYFLNRLKNDNPFYTEMQLKVRNEGGEGYRLVNFGTYEQLFARLQENVKGVISRESFIVSFHPCDMITCSLGYNWSSCQSFVNIFNDFPRGYGQGSNYQGMYNKGNFQFAAGNCFIAYVPYEKLPNVPQYLWAKLKRCLIWVNNDLNCMRQNYFYPGKPSDQETLAFAKVIREYIQNVVAPFNFSNGTMDWKSTYKSFKRVSNIDDPNFDKFTEVYTLNAGRFDDPILCAAYLKGTKDATLIYAADFPTFDTGRLGSSFFKRTYNVCPVCGKQHNSEGLCDHCKAERIEHNGVLVHPSDLLKVTIDGDVKYFDVDELDNLKEYVSVEDGTMVNFKNAYKVFMPSGIKYFKELPNYVKQCKICNEYFHPNFMVGDVCLDHINTVLNDNLDIDIDFDVVLQSFLDGHLSFTCNDYSALQRLCSILAEHGVLWQSGKSPSEFVPSSEVSKGRYLSCNKCKLILSFQPKSSVVALSKLFEKGGE